MKVIKYAISGFFAFILLSTFSLAYAQVDDYKLGAGDRIKIQVYDHPDLNLETELNELGEVNFPLLGKIKLLGVNVTEAEGILMDKLKSGKFINNPHVNIAVLGYRSKKVAVLGEVLRPGQYPLDGAVGLIDVIALAGGMNNVASDRILILRGQEKIELDFSKIVEIANPEKRNFRIVAGDTIYIPKANLFYALGEVQRPGVYKLEKQMTVMQAVAQAGGYTGRASKNKINIFRKNTDNKIIEVPVEITDFVESGDTVIVKESIF